VRHDDVDALGIGPARGVADPGPSGGVPMTADLDALDALVRSLRDHCLAKPGTTDGYPFGPGALVAKVAGRMFALITDDEDPVRVSVKCEPELAELLCQTHDAVSPGYHLNKRHWITVTVDDDVEDQVRSWIDDSYDLVVAGLPRRERDRLQRRV
jgi:predicted DNA-binding protein (MmcQ/YjbR family)